MRNSIKTCIILLLAAQLLAGCLVTPDYKYSKADESGLMAQVFGTQSENNSPLSKSEQAERFRQTEHEWTRQAGSSELITLYLDEEIKAALDERIDSKWRDKRKLRELRTFLFSPNEMGIRYDAAATKTATDTFRLKRGNCLAMTNLFVAAGRYVGFDANYQIVSVKPTWNHEGDTMIRYEHIVAVGDLGDETYVVDFLPEFLIGDRPAEVIDDLEALALYYNNLGAEAVVAEQPELAIDHMRKALSLDLDNSDAWNNMGAAMRRAGRDELAEFSYFQSIKHNAYNYSALSNLAQFYESQGRADDASEIAARVERYRLRNPYFHYFLAQVSMQEGMIPEAQVFIKTAIKLKEDEPEFYEISARIHQVLGEEREVTSNLERAKYYRERKVITPPERTMSHRLMVRKNM